MRTVRRVGCILVLAFAAAPQTPPPQTPNQSAAAVNSSISGTVRDKGTNTPLPNYQVSTNAAANGSGTPPRRITTITDQNGHYKLNDITPGPHGIGVISPTGSGPAGSASRTVTLNGADLENIDFHVVEFGIVSGKVIDENKDPVPNMNVFLVSKEYFQGSLGYYFKGLTRTNSRGEYSIDRVEPGHTYYLMTDTRQTTLPVHSEAPLDPALRKRVALRTWYPNSPSKDGAAPVVVRAAERRDGLDIELKKSPAYCVGGIFSTPNGPGALSFSIAAMDPASGLSNGGGIGMNMPKATTGLDGEFRICDLYPGPYTLTVRQPGTAMRAGVPLSLSAVVVPIVIADQDLTDLRIPTSPNVSLEAEVVLDGPAPQTPVTAQVTLSALPLHDTSQPGDLLNGRVDIPGKISADGLRMDDYHAQANVTGPGLYIKDITYAGRSVQYESIRVGSAAAGSGLRVMVGQDGAQFTAVVTDKDGNAVADTTVLTMPAGTKTEAELAARIVRGGTDQNGQYTSGTLAPGKYFVVATDDVPDYTPETIDKIFQSHTRYQEIELAPNGAARVSLKPMGIR